MSSVYRGSVCPDCEGDGHVTSCEQCLGAGTLRCDLCSGYGFRLAPGEGTQRVPCICVNGRYTCANCSGGTGVCGRCAGSGMLEG